MEGQGQGEVIIPQGEKIIHRSELFDVRITAKDIKQGLTKDIYLLLVLVLENDPLVEREAWVMVEKDIYDSVEAGDQVKLRLYEQSDGRWTRNPPVLPHA